MAKFAFDKIAEFYFFMFCKIFFAFYEGFK